MIKQRNFLIDTQCWLWWHTNPDRLSRQAFELIEDGEKSIAFSVVSAWEIVIKYSYAFTGQIDRSFCFVTY
jgi:PIN domain nuclease of toxin-antitoxin system